MSAIPRQSTLLSPEDYLAGELKSPIKHEYLGGIVHAMAGAKNVHNDIVGNIFAALHSRLRGGKCRPYNSDTKVRLRMSSGQLRFYYPDVQVVCDPNLPDESFQDRPKLIVEVLSKSTRRTDHSEKLEAYTSIPTLDTYLLIDSERIEAVVYGRQGDEFMRNVFDRIDQSIALPGINAEISLAEIYENIVFPQPTPDEEFAEETE
ncbi:MAG: Uma2 family endonuclease [Pirellulales bacterium]